MWGIIFCIIAGISMSIQGVFNTRLSEKIGLWETNVFVQGTALLITIIILLFLGNGSFKNIKEANKLYLLGGIFAVIITYTVMRGINMLNTTYAISTILVAQLTTAGIIDAFGLFESKQIHFDITKYIGVSIMILGIIIFKWKG